MRTSLQQTTQLFSNFGKEEIIRYSRHFALPQVGVAGQKKLKNAKVLCVGAGGLGSPLLLYLAAAGVGTIGIVDSDKVDLSNLQRQILYSQTDQNRSKVIAAQEKLNNLNSSIEIIPHPYQLNDENALELINQYDIVADGTDNYATRYLINDACFYAKKPNVHASIFQFEGQCSVFAATKGPCYRCLFAEAPPAGLIPNCAEGGVLGVLPGIMGSLQATEVIKLILGIGQPLIGRLLMFDALSMTFRELQIEKNARCVLCQKQQPFQDLPRPKICEINRNSLQTDVAEISVQQLKKMRSQKEKFTLLDVRNPYEFAICNLGGTLVPLPQLAEQSENLDRSELIIVHCKSGQRSRIAVQLLHRLGFSKVKNLHGGILAWANEIDPTMRQY